MVTSVVSLVIRLEVEYLSMFENEKSCTLSNISCLRLRAKPADAVEANLPASAPNIRDSTQHPISISPIFNM